MFRKPISQALIFICILAVLIIGYTPDTDARVIANDLSANAVAVYYFTSHTNGFITDYSGRGLNAVLFDNAQLRMVAGRRALWLNSNIAALRTWNDTKSLFINREFSIVAWVKIPRQGNNFLIDAFTYLGRHDDIWDLEEEAAGGAYLSIDWDNVLRGGYEDDTQWIEVESIGGNFNNNRWQHVALVVSSTQMKLYRNGNRIETLFINSHRSVSGNGTAIWIGAGARGSADDVGFFRNDFTDAQIRLIYTAGLANIMSIAPVEPNAKIATTWGALKRQ